MELRYANRPYEISRLRRSIDYVSGTGTLSKSFTINTPDRIGSTNTVFLVDYYFVLYTVSQVTLDTTYYTVRVFSQDRDKGILYVGLNTSSSMTATTIKITVTFSTSSPHTNSNPNFAGYNRYKYTSNNVEKIWNKPFCMPAVATSEDIVDLVTGKSCTGTIRDKTILLETGNPNDVCSFNIRYYIKTNNFSHDMASVSFTNIDMPELKGLNLNSSNCTVTNVSGYNIAMMSIDYNNDNKFNFAFSSGEIPAKTTRAITFLVTLKGYLNFGCIPDGIAYDSVFDTRKGKLPIKYGDTLHVSCRLNIHSDTGGRVQTERFAFNPTVFWGILVKEYDPPEIAPLTYEYDLNYTMKTTLKVEYEQDLESISVLPSPAGGAYADIIDLSVSPESASRLSPDIAEFTMGHYYNEKPLFTGTSGISPAFTENGYIASWISRFYGFTMGIIQYRGYSEGEHPSVTSGKPSELRIEPVSLLENGAVFLIANGTPFSGYLNASYRLGAGYRADNVYIPAGKLNTANDGAVTPTGELITVTKPYSSTAKTIYLNGGSYFYKFDTSFSTNIYIWREDQAETPGTLNYGTLIDGVENLDPGFVSITMLDDGNGADGTEFYYYDGDTQEGYQASGFYSSESAGNPGTITVKTKDNSGGISDTNPVLFFIGDSSSSYIGYGLLTSEY